ncbi:trypco2 family protein [Streptomyces sp. NPDC101194]|uniref:trypco2 family protein n=1 Tax=Streptomyces sp. NPDC101194 TaxID=3366127 RepID=UPI00381806CD
MSTRKIAMSTREDSNGDRIAAGLAETIQALRAELTAAMGSGRDEALRFELGPWS